MRQCEGKSERGLQVFKDMRGEEARGGLHRLSDKRGALTSVYSSVFVDARPCGFVRDAPTLTPMWVRIKMGMVLCDFSMCVRPLNKKYHTHTFVSKLNSIIFFFFRANTNSSDLPDLMLSTVLSLKA